MNIRIMSAYNANQSSEHSRLYLSISSLLADKTDPLMRRDMTAAHQMITCLVTKLLGKCAL